MVTLGAVLEYLLFAWLYGKAVVISVVGFVFIRNSLQRIGFHPYYTKWEAYLSKVIPGRRLPWGDPPQVGMQSYSRKRCGESDMWFYWTDIAPLSWSLLYCSIFPRNGRNMPFADTGGNNIVPACTDTAVRAYITLQLIVICSMNAGVMCVIELLCTRGAER